MVFSIGRLTLAWARSFGVAKSKLGAKLNRPVDAASLAFFRVVFGLALFALCLRFFAHGWIEADYQVPRTFFHYWGFSWVHPWSGAGMYVHYAVMALAALCIAFGIAFRPACVVFAVAFSYAHLCDKANYLNHYYLVSLIAILLIFLPLDREASVRVLRRPRDRLPAVRAWVLVLLRFQVGLVYVFGGIAKLGSDWLLHGEPLRIWLAANTELPLLGRFFDRLGVAIAFSWCGMLFDLSIVPLLLFRRTRGPAYVVLLVFHTLTALLFKIGMFPWLMSIATTLFFEPSWPRALWARIRRRSFEVVLDEHTVAGRKLARPWAFVLAAYALVQVLMPFRFVLYPGNTLWTEEGFRFAWRIMLIEKSGELEYTVVDARRGRTLVDPHEYLTPFQARMTATQPDMILELAHVIARDFNHRGVGPVQVYADAQVSFNGRPSAPLVSTSVDLAKEDDDLRPKHWLLPAPTEAPEF